MFEAYFWSSSAVSAESLPPMICTMPIWFWVSVFISKGSSMAVALCLVDPKAAPGV